MTFLCLFPVDIDGKNEAYFMFLTIKRHFFQYQSSAIENSYRTVVWIYLSHRFTCGRTKLPVLGLGHLLPEAGSPGSQPQNYISQLL